MWVWQCWSCSTSHHLPHPRCLCPLPASDTCQTAQRPHSLPHALNPMGWPYHLCLIYQVLGQITYPTRDFLFCLGLCVHLSLFIYLCAVCLLIYLLIHYLLTDEKCCSYQFTHLLSIVSSPACRGPRSPRSVLLPTSLCGTEENAGGGHERHSWALQTVRGRATVATGAETRAF